MLFVQGKSSDSSLLLCRTCPYDYGSSVYLEQVQYDCLGSLYYWNPCEDKYKLNGMNIFILDHFINLWWFSSPLREIELLSVSGSQLIFLLFRFLQRSLAIWKEFDCGAVKSWMYKLTNILLYLCGFYTDWSRICGLWHQLRTSLSIGFGCYRTVKREPWRIEDYVCSGLIRRCDSVLRNRGAYWSY